MLMNEGTYSGNVKNAGMDVASTGTPCMDIVFVITHIAQNSEWVGIDPQDKHLYLYCSDAAWPYTERNLSDLDFNGDFKNPQFTDKGVILECKHETFKGSLREKWNLPGGGNRERQLPPDDELRKLSTRYKTATANTKKPAGSPSMPVTPPPVSGPPPIDDEIPF